MSTHPTYRPDPALDLVLERVVDVPPEIVWKAWTVPEHLKRWFTPLPYETTECEIDLRPGGIFTTTMRSPEGEETTHIGTYLEVIENERLVWTCALGPGLRPQTDVPMFPFTAVISLVPEGAGTSYTALVMHADAATCSEHDEMGFHEGWGTALDQLVALANDL